jgi:colanic acid/amylovoran biosynthesis glycosyltransferase
VSRLGVDVAQTRPGPRTASSKPAHDSPSEFTLLAVGRLHPVKDHEFLIRACALLRDRAVHFRCVIAGEGPERGRIELLVGRLQLERHVTLLGHVPPAEIGDHYEQADLVVLTSRSEGIPLVLMEAMACGKVVLAPAITVIPELVIAGETGLLYEAGSLEDFVIQVMQVESLTRWRRISGVGSSRSSGPNRVDLLRRAAPAYVHLHFDRTTNLKTFGDLFLARTAPNQERPPHEDLVLQQI